MAKKKTTKKTAKKKALKKLSKAASDLQEVVGPDIKVFDAKTSSTVIVTVDVNAMASPYTVALDGQTLIKSLVDRRERLPSRDVGTHRLGWSFAHVVKGWKHTISLDIDGTSTQLESRSEANKDPDHSVGVALILVS